MTTSKAQAIDLERHMATVALKLRIEAWSGTFDGRGTEMAQRYINRCRRADDVTSCLLIFTRDTGHHSSGWMRNPEFERCVHLSISALPSRLVIPSRQRAELDAKTKRAWLHAFFGDDAAKTWEESAKSAVGIRAGVLHYRLFCDETWAPIMPRGEVYSSELTGLGWRSASQVLEEDGRQIVSTLDPT